MLEEFEMQILKEEHGADVTFFLELPADRMAECLADIQKKTNGTFLVNEE